MNEQRNRIITSSVNDSKEVPGQKFFLAFFLGMSVIVASIVLGPSYIYYGYFLFFSLVMTLLWRNNPRPLILLILLATATPIPIAQQQVACNLIFAIWVAFFKPGILLRVPRWINVAFVLALLGFLTSSINWLGGSILRQGSFFYTFFWGPVFLLPAIYSIMKESRDHAANLRGLLFCLIVPSTLLLVSAKFFGTITNEWEASLHTQSLAEGFYIYQIGKATISFLRTQIGFVLAALICASAAITFSQVGNRLRLIAGGCLLANIILLMVTGSFGSAFSCFCGLLAILFFLFRSANISRVIVSVFAICAILLTSFHFLPSNIKDYLAKRYEHRVTVANTDRLGLWSRAAEHFLKHPEGVGFTLSVGHTIKTHIHNEYLVYAVSYGLFGGLAFAFVVFRLLVSFYFTRKSKINDPYALAIYLAGLGVTTAMALNCITDHMNANRWYCNIIWSLIWYCYFCSLAAQNDEVGKSGEV